MNKTEIKGLQYILTNTKYTEKDVQFQPHSSPDFLCSDGHGYEVKLINRNDIIFHESQWNELKQKDIDVLAFYPNSDIPLIIPIKNLNKNEITLGIKILVYKKKETNESRTLSLPESKWIILDEMAKKYTVASSQELIRRCIDAMIKGELKP